MYSAHAEKTPLLVADPAQVLPPSGVANDLMRSHFTVDGKLLKYDPWRASSCAVLARIGGTVFGGRTLWLHGLAYSLLWASTFAVFRFGLGGLAYGSTREFSEFAADAAILVGLLLAVNMAVGLQRWLAMRRDVVGGLWAAIDDLALVLAAHLPAPASRPVKTLALRYGLASFELLLASEDQQEEASCLDSLLRRGLLREQERDLLQPLPSKAKVPWVWAASLFRQLAQRGRLQSRVLLRLYEICNRGRGACDRAAACRHSTLPLAYAHMLATLVHAASFLLAVRCGVAAAAISSKLSAPRASSSPSTSTSGLLAALALQFLLAGGAPVALGALLSCALILADPLSPQSVQGLPSSAYRVFMRDECEAFHTAGENLPKAVARAVERGAQDSDFLSAQDLVAIV